MLPIVLVSFYSFGNLFQGELLPFVGDEMSKESTSNVGCEHGLSFPSLQIRIKPFDPCFYIPVSEVVFAVEVI